MQEGCRKFNFRSTTTRDWQQLCQQQQQPLKPQAKVQTPLAPSTVPTLPLSPSVPTPCLPACLVTLSCGISLRQLRLHFGFGVNCCHMAGDKRKDADPCGRNFLPPLPALSSLFPHVHSPSLSLSSCLFPLQPFSRLMIQLQRRQPSQKLTHCLHRLGSLPSLAPLTPFSLSSTSLSLHPLPAFSTVFPSLCSAVICDFYKVFAALACVSCCAFFGLCQRCHVTFARHLTDTCRLPKPPTSPSTYTLPSLSLSPIHSLFSPHPIRARIRPVRQCKHLKSSLACQLKWQQQIRLGNTLWKGKRARGWLCKVKKKIQRLTRAEDVDERERIKEYVIENTLLT